ncbi:hypothetical protein GH714_037639 [Hevea brasiliensis]|uniref:YGGT family protein n=1 Tax=Hevea brasiliensis TaxID=3981 RepID=A0A6A6KC51_HEVBR|nr:hypothetical protein GH714_037639 [Hevea brasiliensis]
MRFYPLLTSSKWRLAGVFGFRSVGDIDGSGSFSFNAGIIGIQILCPITPLLQYYREIQWQGLCTLCDPYLNIFRGIIPPLGGTLDFSPILAFLVLNAFTSTAAALPAELPGTEASQGNCPPHRRFTNLTTSQNKWMRRCYGNKAQSSTGAN